MTNSRHPIVVAYDGSPDSEAAVIWAAETASLMNLPLTAVVVGPRPGEGNFPDWDEELLLETHARAQVTLKEAGAGDAVAELRRGPVAATLLEEAQNAELMVVGSQGHGRVEGALIGSVSQHLTRHANCPVVVVRRPARPGPSRILVGVDDSGGSAAALEFACRRADLTHEPVVALHGWRLPDLPVDKHGDVPEKVARRILAEQRRLAESVAGLAEEFPDVEIRAEAIPVAAPRILVDGSVTASLLVVGSRGRGAFAGMLLGSVSQEVVARAQCPVAVVR